jgi:hypothetical protein
MRKCVVMFFVSCFALSGAKAKEYVSGLNFEVFHPTTISAVGAYDGGASFTATETVGVFNEVTGNLVGSEVVFGPGAKGTQVGEMFYENVPSFVLTPGDYSLITISTGDAPPFGASGGHLSGGNSDQNLNADAVLPGGGRFNSGADFDISLIENSGSGSQPGFIDLVDPSLGTVPDGGMTAMLLGAALAGLGWVRRKL